MFREFWTWWVGQLADCIPKRWRQLGSASSDALLVAPVRPIEEGVETVDVSLRRYGRETPIGQFDVAGSELAALARSTDRPAVLRLAGADILSKTLTLPLATERELGQVLAFEMDRETPFNAEEVFWSHRVIARDRERAQVSVRLLLAPRASLASVLGPLARVGIVPKRAEIGAGPDQGAYLWLGDDSERGGKGSYVLRSSALAVALALAVAVTATPLMRLSANLTRLDQEIAKGRAAAAEAAKLHQEIDRSVGAADLVETEREAAGHPLVTLAALTRMLPDDTYLSELSQQQHKVTMSGRSSGASRLIALLAAGRELRNPSFSAPVTRIEGARTEAFTITAEVAP